MGVIRWSFCWMWLAASAMAAAPQSTTTPQTTAPHVAHKVVADKSSPHHPVAAQPNIVLITLDTTRADRMGFLGSKRGLTPNLDSLAQQSGVFTRAYAQAPLTPASHATILSGTYPQFHQVLDFPMRLSETVPYAPDILHGRGYHTAAFVASLALDPAAGAPGFDRGFDTYDAGFDSKNFHNKARYETIERRGGEVVNRAIAWLNLHSKGPFFLWVHLYDAHDPYDPPEPYKTKYATELYDGEIAYEDFAVGKLLRHLKTRGLYDGAVIAVMADHGESLGAHGEDTHGFFLYDETIQVPLAIKLPYSAAQTRIDNRVELVDVMPTLLQAVNVPIPAEVQGESLVGIIQEKDEASTDKWRDRPAYSQADYAHLAYGWAALQSLRTGKYLYVQAPRRELYDQTADPGALNNLATASTAVADTLAAKVVGIQQKTSSHRELQKTAVDSEAQEKLAALGYVTAGSNASKISNADIGADPKDKIVTANTIRQINFLLEDERFDESVVELQKLLEKNPDMAMIYAKLGGCYMKLHDYEKAIPPLRRAIALDPNLNMAAMDLGRALIRVQDYKGAATEFESIVAKTPGMLDAHLFLEIAYARLDQVPEAIKESQLVLQAMPNHFGSYMILGRSLAKTGKPEEGIADLEKAAAIRPESAEPHRALSEIYKQMGRKLDADRETALADQLRQSAAMEP